MIDHVTIRVDDLEQSRRFYALALELLGAPEPAVGEDFVEWNDFSLAPASRERRSTRRLHVAFQAPSREAVGTWWGAMTAVAVTVGYAIERLPGRARSTVTAPASPWSRASRRRPSTCISAVGPEAVRAFHTAGVTSGFESLGAPGERPEYHAGYFAAYLSDPDGNNVEAVFHDR